jgi:hypothetical protein
MGGRGKRPMAIDNIVLRGVTSCPRKIEAPPSERQHPMTPLSARFTPSKQASMLVTRSVVGFMHQAAAPHAKPLNAKQLQPRGTTSQRLACTYKERVCLRCAAYLWGLFLHRVCLSND